MLKYIRHKLYKRILAYQLIDIDGYVFTLADDYQIISYESYGVRLGFHRSELFGNLVEAKKYEKERIEP